MTTYAKTIVTPVHINSYNENGYILFEKLIDEETLDALRVETDRVVAEASELTEYNAQYDLEDSHSVSDPRVRRLKSPSSN